MKRSIGSILALGLLLVGGPSVLAQQAELPPNAKPGECYARVFTPPVYTTDTERVLKQEASERIEIIPARYNWEEEIYIVEDVVQNGKVVMPAGTRISASDLAELKRGTATRFMTEKLEAVPARYEWVSEKVLVTPARTVWKEGRGPIEKVDQSTGEIMCLVEEPAVYKTVRKQVLKSPATTRTTTTPVKYKTVRVQKLSAPASERRIEIPAKYETITKRSMVKDGSMEWKPILCQTNMSPSLVMQLQRALNRAGHSAGDVDGVIGGKTMAALRSYQRSKGLSSGGVTMETLRSLGVNIGG